MSSQISTSSASKTSKLKAKPLRDQTNLPKINKYFKPVFNYKKCVSDFAEPKQRRIERGELFGDEI